MNIKIDNNSFNHEIIELIKAFHCSEDINIVEDLIDGLYIKEEKNFIRIQLIKESKTISTNRYQKDNKDLKNSYKRAVYSFLEYELNISLPWGILTGIRPMKIVHKLDRNDKDIDSILSKKYKIDYSNIELVKNIRDVEKKHLDNITNNSYSIYISIPFCPSKCLYCSFPSGKIDIYKRQVERYINSLIYEMEEVSLSIDKNKIETVYIGGGTPTSIDPIYLERLIENIYRIFGRNNIKELTVEGGRPDTLSTEYLKMLSRMKVDRISINPQTMNNKTLTILGRNHKKEDILETYEKAKRIGNYSINMDLILGLPGEDICDVINTFQEISELGPDNITVHTLSVKRGSRFKDHLEEYKLTSYPEVKEMIDYSKCFLSSHGYKPYYLYRQKQSMGNFENIGYSKNEKECLYNIYMMEEEQTILGFGVGSISKIYDYNLGKIYRTPNVKSLKLYFERIDEMVERKINLLKQHN